MFLQFREGQDVWAYGVEPAKVKYRLRLARYPALAEKLTHWLKQRDPDALLRLLDVGAGYGRTFLYLAAAGIADNFELIGVDIDPARKDDVYRNDTWDIRQGDAEQGLDFDDDSLDVIVCEQLLEHLHKPNNLLAEINRVLKPDGLFVVGVPTFPEPIAALRRWRVKRFGLGRSEHIQTYSLRSVRRDLEIYFDVQDQYGFRIISGGLLRWLENYEWWYRFNRRLGAWLPGLCVEVQLLVTPKR